MAIASHDIETALHLPAVNVTRLQLSLSTQHGWHSSQPVGLNKPHVVQDQVEAPGHVLDPHMKPLLLEAAERVSPSASQRSQATCLLVV